MARARRHAGIQRAAGADQVGRHKPITGRPPFLNQSCFLGSCRVQMDSRKIRTVRSLSLDNSLKDKARVPQPEAASLNDPPKKQSPQPIEDEGDCPPCPCRSCRRLDAVPHAPFGHDDNDQPPPKRLPQPGQAGAARRLTRVTAEKPRRELRYHTRRAPSTGGAWR